MKTRILAIILCICTVIGATGIPSVYASALQPNGDISPRWQNINSITLDMSFSNGTVTSSARVTGQTGTTKISATFTLERLTNGQYKYVDSWPADSTTILLSSSRSTTSCTTGTYKISISGTATKNGVVEPFSDSLIKNF